ncbi:hypothetical protein IEQ34_000496 [Dendrobium chrysotoxum]|uniref:Uncharacterized protein n=1 Tax=Dendrobium chrysotoxum TaxID=161865 RepID=A0AAV7HSD1_DENCH|nr:hypothetical protein IEQ34_000496 [Dendrobium chrysotoxum]
MFILSVASPRRRLESFDHVELEMKSLPTTPKEIETHAKEKWRKRGLAVIVPAVRLSALIFNSVRQGSPKAVVPSIRRAAPFLSVEGSGGNRAAVPKLSYVWLF